MSKSNQEHRRSQHRPRQKSLLPWVLLVALVFCAGLVIGYLKIGSHPQETPVVPEATVQPSREVILYFASADGQQLIAENCLIDDCQSDEECLQGTIKALIDGPQGGLIPILPAQADLRGVTVNDSLVSLDFSQELIAAHPGGTQSELLTVYGLADTVAVNFPHLRQVQIMVDGHPVTTLKGHVDLRQPLSPDFSLVQEAMAPTGNMTNIPAGRDE